jgi:hypothetical protein
MKRTLLLSVFALAVALPATAGTPGYVDFSVGTVDLSNPTGSLDLDTVSGGGSVAVNLSGAWNAQFDGSLVRYEIATARNFAAHVFHDGGNWAVGGVFDYWNIYGAAQWTLGLEAQVTLGAFVLEGGASTGNIEDGPSNVDVWNAEASVTWFATPDLSFSGTVGTVAYDVASDAGSTTYGVEAEYRFDQSPFSLFVAYERADVEGLIEYEADSWGLGLRYGFGDGSLQARRDEGPRWLRQDRRALRFLD